MKKELIYQNKPKTFEETKKSLLKLIEGWYNNYKIQKKLGYLFHQIVKNKLHNL
ncbi:hypothetical protein [Cetobacterium sp.]|uniref:hypothetical protein n=1 Tax=Cetobacterium sp. TaxID=2071632 RepID=UPI003EE50980